MIEVIEKEGNMNNLFKEMGIAEPIIKAIQEMGFEKPTEVQERVIPKILNKQDLIVMSKTGSGKTAAFGIPILQNVKGDEGFAEALILTPTRELAVQVDKEINVLSQHMPFKTAAVYGQHSMATEIKALRSGVTIVTGTPGRVFHHISEKNFDTKKIKFLVLDEADRMLDMGFIDQVIKIIKALPKDRVTLLFSATMPPAIKRICQSYMKNPESVEIGTDTKTVDTIQQLYYRVERNEKRMQLDRILKFEQPDSCMVFCNTRDEVDRVQKFLASKGYFSKALHGTKTQTSRMNTIQKFKSNDVQVLVATDIAARGIHVDDLSLVVNYDIPQDKDSYIHRIGRTGRAGNGGKAIAFVTSEDIFDFYEIEEHVGALIVEETLPTDEGVKDALSKATGKWANLVFVQQPGHEDDTIKTGHHRKGPGNNHQSNHSGPKKPYVKSDSKPYNKSKHIEEAPIKEKQVAHKKPTQGVHKKVVQPKVETEQTKQNAKSYENKRKSNYKGNNYDPNYKKDSNYSKPISKPIEKVSTPPVASVATKTVESQVKETVKKKSLISTIGNLFKGKKKD